MTAPDQSPVPAPDAPFAGGEWCSRCATYGCSPTCPDTPPASTPSSGERDDACPRCKGSGREMNAEVQIGAPSCLACFGSGKNDGPAITFRPPAPSSPVAESAIQLLREVYWRTPETADWIDLNDAIARLLRDNGGIHTTGLKAEPLPPVAESGRPDTGKVGRDDPKWNLRQANHALHSAQVRWESIPEDPYIGHQIRTAGEHIVSAYNGTEFTPLAFDGEAYDAWWANYDRHAQPAQPARPVAESGRPPEMVALPADELRAAVEALPVNALVRIGWITPSGNCQGGTYLRTRDGIRSTYTRDNWDATTLRQTCVGDRGGYKVVALPVDAQPARPVSPVDEEGRRLDPTMHIIRRADGEEMGEYAFWATDGPDGWDHAENTDHDEDTVYEILACYPVARRKILWSTLCETCDGEGDGCPACAGSGEQEPPDAEHMPIVALAAADREEPTNG